MNIRHLNILIGLAIIVATAANATTAVVVKKAPNSVTYDKPTVYSSNGLFVYNSAGKVRMNMTGWNNSKTGNAPAGVYNLYMNVGYGDILFNSFCTDPTVYITPLPSSDYVVVPTHVLFNDDVLKADKVERLWANAFNQTIGNPVKAVAFQAIVWELKLDDVIDFSAGNARILPEDSTGFSAQVLSQAQEWVHNLDAHWVERASLFGLQSSTHQSLLTAVPEPSSLAAVGAALTALTSLFRRRR